MERWVGKIAVVTGASAGIGAAIAVSLADKGLTVVALARREDKLTDVCKTTKGNITGMRCDVSNPQEIETVFRNIEKRFGGVDLLVNNAAQLLISGIADGSYTDWKSVLDTNVLGLSICSKEALKTMKNRENGHIINVNSIAGHSVPTVFKGPIGMYPASKHAVTALTKILRYELRSSGSTIKVTSLSPGLVITDMGLNAISHVKIPDGVEAPSSVAEIGLTSQDIADAVISIISMHPRVEIQELTLQVNTLAF